MPLHTPYDGSHKPFTISLKPLDRAEWIAVDDRLGAYLDEKKRLYAEEWANVYAAVEGMAAAEQEVLELLARHLPERFPDVYARRGDLMRIRTSSGKRQVTLGSRFRANDGSWGGPLAVAGQLVQEDLCLMAKREGAWALAAASLCFPSAWSLKEKIGKPMHAVHGPVPGFGAGTRNAGLIERMFDNLRVEQPVIRWNWTLFGQDRLYHPGSGGEKRRFGDGEVAENVFLRFERQTLRKLPQTGAILFTIRTYIDPVTVLERDPDGAGLARAVMEQVSAFTPEELSYKGLTQERDRVLARFRRIAAAA